MSTALSVNRLHFAYRHNTRSALVDFSLDIDEASRCLVIGRNGAGKSTLLQVLAGRHMVPEESVTVLGRPAFHDVSLVHDVAHLGGLFPFDTDIAVHEILSHTPHLAERRDKLLTLLGIDTAWRMRSVSDGQRRRVQLLMGLLKPHRLLLLDEVTSDLDLLARIDLLKFLREENETQNTTILYATHVFDNLETWATHLLWIDAGAVRHFSRLAEIEELSELMQQRAHNPLMQLVARWLRK